MIEYASCTVTGRRGKNEDSCHIPLRGELPILIVADGMGGHNAGSTASAMAVSEVLASLHSPLTEAELRRAVHRANAAIYDRSKEELACHGMGTTIVTAAVTEEEYIAGNIGDSRLYHIRGGAITQITLDHSLVAILVREGHITKEQAKHHPRRNIITRALGTERTEELDIFREPWQEGDILLLCTDGLHGSLSEEEMMRILQSEEPLSKKCEALVSLAYENGSTDNITAVLAQNKGGEAL